MVFIKFLLKTTRTTKWKAFLSCLLNARLNLLAKNHLKFTTSYRGRIDYLQLTVFQSLTYSVQVEVRIGPSGEPLLITCR